jgi:hypothetical protein
MLNNNTVVRRSPFLDLFLPQRPLQRLALCFFILCLIGSAAGITVIVHEQSNQVLLVGTAAVQQPAATPVATTSSTGSVTKNTLSPSLYWSADVTAHLVRVNQLDPEQYANAAEYTTWAYSACSTASMTEVLNAWWGFPKYRIADVLIQEVAAKAISSDQGLLDDSGIERTMRRFGFLVTWGHKWTLDQLISIARKTPVIVGLPPNKYPGGHLLVLRGGDANNVLLTDSSRLNMQTKSRAWFMQVWGGSAWIAQPSLYSILGKPTMSVARINQILAAYHSPLVGHGQEIYNTTTHYGIDPTLAMGFYLHESTMGTAGEARMTHSWGNLRCVSDAACVNQQGTTCQLGQSCYAAFPDGIAGLTRWCQLMVSDVYVLDGLVIVDDIIGRYAPASDNNNEGGYIWSLKHSTDRWRAGAITV